MQFALFGLITFLLVIVSRVAKAYGIVSFFHNKAAQGQGVQAWLVIEGSKPYRNIPYDKHHALPTRLDLDLHRMDIRVASISRNSIEIAPLLARLDRTFSDHFQPQKWGRIAPAPPNSLDTSVIIENPVSRHAWTITYWSDGSMPSDLVRKALENCFELDDLSLTYEQCQQRSRRHLLTWGAVALLFLPVGVALRMFFPSLVFLWAGGIALWYLVGLAWVDLLLIHEIYTRARMAKV